MWLITNFGFFSVVEKEQQNGSGLLTIRGRVRADLEALRKRYLPGLGPIQAGKGTDYKYRAVAARADIAEAFRRAIEDINYDNFKDSVESRQGSERAAIYHQLWSGLRGLAREDVPATASRAKLEEDRAASPADFTEWPPYEPVADESPPGPADWRTRMWLRPNQDLIGFDRNHHYALTIDGYAYARRVWAVELSSHTGGDKVSSFERPDGSWIGPFEDLRCCLFWLQRLIRGNEQNVEDEGTRRRYDRLYEAVCDAWGREHPAHDDLVRVAYAASAGGVGDGPGQKSKPQADAGSNAHQQRPTAADMDEILKFLPDFEQPGFQAGRIVGGPGELPDYVLSQRVGKFVRTLHERGMIEDFDWPRWQTIACDFVASPEKLVMADLQTLQRLLTTHVRKERFSAGHLASMFKSGHIPGILRRLQAIRLNM